jgi:hypothetical protein
VIVGTIDDVKEELVQVALSRLEKILGKDFGLIPGKSPHGGSLW